MKEKFGYIKNLKLNYLLPLTEDKYTNNYKGHIEKEVTFYKNKGHKKEFKLNPKENEYKNLGPFTKLNKTKIKLNCPTSLIKDIQLKFRQTKQISSKKKLRLETIYCIASQVWYYSYKA